MWLTIDELAEYLKVSKETIYKMAKANKLPSSKIGNQWRFNRQIIDQWLVNQTSFPTTLTEKSAGRDYTEVK